MIRPKNDTEDVLLSITENCETLIKQPHTKPQETIEFKVSMSKALFISIQLYLFMAPGC